MLAEGGRQEAPATSVSHRHNGQFHSLFNTSSAHDCQQVAASGGCSQFPGSEGEVPRGLAVPEGWRCLALSLSPR